MSECKGGCLCGSIQYEISVTPDPQMQFTCHCRDCQQVTGAGHARSMGVPEGSISWTGQVKVYHIQHDESVVDSAFCGDCGSPIYKASSKLPGFIFFHAGSLDPEFNAGWESKQQVFLESRQGWDTLD